jgi:hypothetical protein
MNTDKNGLSGLPWRLGDFALCVSFDPGSENPTPSQSVAVSRSDFETFFSPGEPANAFDFCEMAAKIRP